MDTNPFLGVTLHAIGGLAAASFYLPYKRVRGWSWETYWITGGIFSWLFAPIIAALIIVAGVYKVPLFEVLSESPTRALLGAFGFGALWGIGGLTFGLSMRYLGIALGYAIALGFCAAFGTLIPPLFEGTFRRLLTTTPGLVVLGGVLLCVVGIAFSGMAGISKERELTDEQKRSTVAEFNFGKGLIIATACGLLSACMAFALAAGDPISKRAVELGTPALWSGLPTLIIVLLGGLATNLVWCAILLTNNRSFGEFVGRARAQANTVVAPDRAVTEVAATEAVAGPAVETPRFESQAGSLAQPARVSLVSNYLFSALAGLTWYLQFFFYTMGGSKMGERFGFSSWTLHMASIIIFSTIWGILLREWTGTSRRTHIWIALGLAVLILSTVVVGWGNYLGSQTAAH